MAELIASISASDQATIAISTLALLVAIAAVVVPAFKSDRDNRTLVRQQMNALILEINSAIVEYVQMTAMSAGTKREQDARTFAGMLVVQKATPLSMQAVVLINTAPEVMNEMDYSITGDIARIAKSWEIANKCYEIAIRKSRQSKHSTLFNRVTFVRGYAHILFEQDKFEEGRKMYREAIDMVTSDDDIHKDMNGYTHFMWYVDESQNVLNHVSSEPHYFACRTIYESINNRSVRSDALNMLEAAKELISNQSN